MYPPHALVRHTRIVYPSDKLSNCVPDTSRYAAAFRAILPNETEEEVFSLVGSRSGSMEITCFMGVNTVPWDEPLFHTSIEHYYSYYISNQGQPFLLLPN
jgi:hypothetical protein